MYSDRAAHQPLTDSSSNHLSNYPDENNSMSVPRPFTSTGSTQSSISDSVQIQPDFTRGSNPYSSYSTPSLPRYSSAPSSASSTNYLPHPSPLNPSAARSNREVPPIAGGAPNRYSAYAYGPGPTNGQITNGAAHPLSNTMYMDSSPTLAGSEVLSPSEEKMRYGSGLPSLDYLNGNTLHKDNVRTSNEPAPFRRASPKPTGFSALYRGWSGASIGDSGRDERHVKLPRLGYLDGCKFIAAWVVLNGTLFDAVLGPDSNDYSVIQRGSPLYITRSTGLGITFLLLLMGRSLITPLWDVPVPAPGSKVKSALISWARLTRAMLVRPFRFLLPVIVIAALQWGLGSSGKTGNCNNVGMDEPYWGLIASFAGYSTLVFDLFTWFEYDTVAGQTFAANLWTNAWFFQASYAVYVAHLMLGNLSSNRYWVYALLGFFSWTTYNYFFVAFLGVVLSDMHAHGHLHRIRSQWSFMGRLTLHVVLIALACVTQFVPVIRDNINSGMATINVQAHPELTFCDSIFAFCWLFCIETSGLAQNILGNVVMRQLGKISPGMYLLAPAITFTIVPDLALSLHNKGSSASSVLGVSWLVLFFITVAFAIWFHFFVELPSKLLGECFAETLEGWNGGKRYSRKGADGNVKLTRRSGPPPAALSKAKPVLA